MPLNRLIRTSGGLLLIPFNAGNDAYTFADTTGSVQQRIVDLGPSVGKTINGFWPITTSSGSGTSDMFLSNASIVSSNGTATPIFNGQAVDDHGPLDSCTGANDGLLVQQSSTPTTTFYVADQVGTAQMEFSATGAPLWRGDFAPFGQELDAVPYYFSNGATNGTDNRYRFTGKERDTESGLDYFGARYYASSMGRFMSPDPSGLLYADSGNPQSLNLYSYVLNNPLKFTDPTGMYCDYSDHNDPQSGFDSSQFDYNSNSGECGQNGGQWVDDAYTHNGADDANRPQNAVSSNTNAPNGPWTFDDFNAMYQAWNQGLLPQQLNYGPNSWEAQDMSRNYFVQRARNAYVQAGCPASFPMAAGHYEAAFASWGNASTDVLMGNNPDFLALEVGGWSGSIQTSGDTASFTINNPMTQSSFGGESAAHDTHTTDNPNGPNGPRHNVMQTFAWSERGLCHH